MRSDRDNRTDSEREIDEFLSRFETPVDELSADINSYLSETSTTKMTAARTFYGDKYNQVVGNDPDAGTEPAETSDSPAADMDTAEDASLSPSPAASAENPETAEPASTADTPDASGDSVKPSAEEPAKPAKKAATGSKKKKKKKRKKKKNTKAAKAIAAAKNVSKEGILTALFLKPNPKFNPDKPVSSANKAMVFSIGKLFRDIVGVGLVCVLCAMLYALGCITFAPKIDPKDIYASVDTSSMIYDDEGKQVDSVFYTQNRRVIKYENMPEDLINSFVAIEDKTFWKHHGFNWTRMIGAVLSSFTGGGRISGTSTITQQLARNVYLSDIKSQRSIRRKIVEMYYASKIERALSKEEIIEAYLNSIYLGYGCYGVDAAARTYFSTTVDKLNLVECAALAALPQAPEDYALLKYAADGSRVSDDSKIVQKDPDTIVTNDIARERRNLTLKLMLQQNYITQEQYEASVDVALNSFINPTITSGFGIYSYFHEYLVDTIINDLMEQYGMDYADAERTVYTKGLKIYSTVDSQAQEIVVNEFKDSENFPSVSAIHNTDEDGNMLNNDGDIALYNYDHFFDENGNFTLAENDVAIAPDGSVTIGAGRDLNIYTTEVNGETDYSLEFKTYYRIIDDKVYSIQGGYINVPSTYKSMDSNGNLVISADYFNDPAHEGDMRVEDGKLIITDEAYSLAVPTLQPQGAMVIVGVGTGEVKAMVGGRTFKGQKLLNRAINARQPGSSIKPLAVYGAALQKSYELEEKNQKWTFIDFDIDKQGTKGWGDYVTVHSSIEDEKCHIENRDWPENVTRTFSGKNTFKTAIQQSINTCAVKLQLQVGNEFSMNQLKKFGITTAIDDESEYANDMNPAALGLGAMCQGVEPLEMALAYASFPAGGQVNTPICYTKVLDRNGNVLLEGKSEASEAINEGVAFIMTDVLQSVVKANHYGIDAVATGGKTGTTNDRYDIWFDGFTPSYAGAIWIGTDQNVEMDSMSYVAARLWGKIMNQIPKAAVGEYPAQPANVISRGGEYFTEGTDTGLTSWSDAEEKKKRKAAAKKKWEAERENHKVWVIDVPGHYQTIHHDAEYGTRQVEVTKTRTVVDQEAYDDEFGQHHDAITHEETYTEMVTESYLIRDAWDEQGPWVDEVGHWEYEKGYRAGDFKYKGD